MNRLFTMPLAAALLLTTYPLAWAQGTSTNQFFCGDVNVMMSAYGSHDMESSNPLIGACVGTVGEYELRIRRNSISLNGSDYDVVAESTITLQETYIGRLEWSGWALTVDGETVDEVSPILALEAAVEGGDLDAQAVLAQVYFTGDIYLDQDVDRAIELALEAAEGGNATAQRFMAFRYYHGDGIENDDAEAVRLAELAAAEDQVAAQRLLGIALFHGRGAERDIPRALELWSTAADAGDALSAFNMGVVIQESDAVTFNRQAAIAWFELALELGDEDAQARLDELNAETE